ncbi:TM1266 family iron-only hydrogenase system putative regulator [Desulforudis sp. 1088]|uniref:TM1266 family iron-only hydrogenase system putative regulator n=1 Tax=unclassified Candidatus Desulforudis TaxID=2635950 RepID=UPI003CE555DF
MADGIYVVGILVEERASRGPEVQEVLTRYGSKILCRTGIPDPSKKRGIITVTMQADAPDVDKFKGDLQDIAGVRAQSLRLADAIYNCPA